jgi:MGT family glycosyltransferase
VPDARLLFVSLGTVVNDRADFFRLCVEAFGDTDWHVAMAVGDWVDLPETPANFEVRRAFPQLEVLYYADAFITHAGMNSTMEALLFEVPTAAFPQTPEQEVNARRTEELGLGRLIDRAGLDAARLREIVEDVSADEDIRRNLKQMRSVLQAGGGAKAGADAIERFVS